MVGQTRQLNLALVQTGLNVSGFASGTVDSFAPFTVPVAGTVTNGHLTITGSFDEYSGSIAITQWATTVDDKGSMLGTFTLRSSLTLGSGSNPPGETWTYTYDEELVNVVRQR